jgi:hypothetical protein
VRYLRATRYGTCCATSATTTVGERATARHPIRNRGAGRPFSHGKDILSKCETGRADNHCNVHRLSPFSPVFTRVFVIGRYGKVKSRRVVWLGTEQLSARSSKTSWV